MRVELLSVPYDSGMRGARMGAGPGALLASGLVDRLTARGCDVVHAAIELPEGSFLPEGQAAFELNRRLAGAVSAATAFGAFPMVLSGNCITSIGTVGGLGEPELGAIWFDAHGDFNTPETTRSGFLDGMSLGILTGRCWQSVAGTVPGFAPLSDDRVILVGARSLDRAEETSLSESRITRVTAESARDGLRDELSGLRKRARDLYLHIDLDVLDPSEGSANSYATANGLSVAELQGVIQDIAGMFRVRAVALTAYDPAHDENGKACESAMSVLQTVVDAVALSQET
ncbi:MAG TPA: arginase family protein [Gemmatimonadaceae bacterium]